MVTLIIPTGKHQTFSLIVSQIPKIPKMKPAISVIVNLLLNYMDLIFRTN